LTFGYNDEVQLVTITDALGNVTTLTYNADGLVERVDDPFGRFASFEYDADRNLTKATDMGGYWTEYRYDTDVYLTSIENPRGKWNFTIEPSDNSGANSDNTRRATSWQNYRITIANPLEEGGIFLLRRLRYIYMLGYTWYVSPERLYDGRARQ
jgi:YD repeat-containing protein